MTHRLEYIADRLSNKSIAAFTEFTITIDVPAASICNTSVSIKVEIFGRGKISALDSYQ